MGVGPLHTIDEVAEGNEAMEKRERQEGITTGQAKGRTQRWQPLQPKLARVNEAARRRCHTNLDRRGAGFGMRADLTPWWRLATSGTLRLLGREACGGM
jgi:hypothetical protein